MADAEGRPAPRLRLAGQRCRSLGCHHRGRHGGTSALERLTEHSVYARVLPATSRESNGEAPDARAHYPPTVPGARRDSRRGRPDPGQLPRRCSKSGQSSSSAPTLTIAAPDHPVKWDIPEDNKPIADGLAPEKDATLQLYNYADYLSPDAVKSFEEKYNTKVQISTFNDTDEALTKIRGGNVDYDIYFPSYDQISKLVTGRPGPSDQPQLHPEHQERVAELHKSVVRPGMAFLGAEILHHRHRMADDQVPETSARCPIPMTRYGIRRTRIRPPIIDDWHTAMAMVLLRAGKTDVNTTSAEDLKLVGDQLNALVAATSPKVTITMYTDMPAGQIGLARCGRATSSTRRTTCPRGQPRHPAVLVPRRRERLGGQRLADHAPQRQEPGAGTPVHQPSAGSRSGPQNFAQTGYQPPQNSSTPDSLVSERVHPRNLAHRCRQAGVLRHGLPAAANSTRRTTPRGTRSGRQFKAGRV